MFTNLAFHGKPAAAAAAPGDDKKTLALKEAMANWEVATMSDLLPASIRPLAKKPAAAHAFSAIAARPSIDDADAPVFAPVEDWSWNMLEKLVYLSRMTKGDMAWAHRV